MEMMYHIDNLCPRTDIDMGRCGFTINLYPGFKKAVAASGLDQNKVDTVIKNMHRAWLDGCGYGRMYDPDKTPMQKWEEEKLGKAAKLGPNARPLYGEREIRVTWGEWGLNHITVPGDACGLDISGSSGGGMKPYKGECLYPHNVDSINQAMMLLVVFTFFAGLVIDQIETKEWDKIAKS